MKGLRLSDKDIQNVINFHGHFCPGLAIGIKACELLNRRFENDLKELTAVVETDMCGVDAVQYFTECTFGKGNLIHLDYGKNAFSFFRKRDGKSERYIALTGIYDGLDGSREFAELREKMSSGSLTDDEMDCMIQLREHISFEMMKRDPVEMFTVTETEVPFPRGPRILNSITCENCGEGVMESRVRIFRGRNLCIPCFREDEKRF